MTGWLNPASYGPHSRQWLGHYFRYHLAAGFIRRGDVVLDAACGCGYGARVLARRARCVIAVDGDDEALAIARRDYGHPRVYHRFCDLDADKRLHGCDVAVSFETLEHLHDPEGFVARLQKAAHRLIIISTPVVPTVGVNPHHLRDFSEESFASLVLAVPWTLWESVRQGPYQIIVAYRDERSGNDAGVLGKPPGQT